MPFTAFARANVIQNIVQFNGGSAATPGVSFVTQPSTGLFLSGANVGVSVGGVEKASVSSSGLTVNGSVSASTFVGDGSLLTGISSTPSLSIANVQITDSSYVVADDLAVSTTLGGYVVVNGSGFAPGSMVKLGTDFATAVSYVSSNQLRTTVPAKTSGSYDVTVIRGDTATATLALGITYSAFPAWSTSTDLGNVTQNIAFTRTLAAPSDSNVTYANTSAIPPQTTLTSNGTLSGNITSVEDATIYTFSIKATDLELQDVSRTFQLEYILVFAISDLSAITSIAHRSFVIAGTRAYGFGWNSSGQLGTGNTTDTYTPTNIMGNGSLVGKKVSKIAIGTGVTFILCTDSTLHAFGANEHSVFGNGNTTNSSLPVNVSSNGSLSGRTIKEVSAGNNSFAMAVCTDGTLHAMGYNGNGQLGTGDTTIRTFPTNVSSNGSLSGKTISKVACSTNHTIVLCTDGSVHTMGYNYAGQLGTGNTSNSYTPINISSNGSLSGKTAMYIGCGNDYSVVLCTDFTLHNFGYNGSGQLGTGGYSNVLTPTNISSNGSLSGKTISKISVGREYMLILCSDGTFHSMGGNGNGQLGNGGTGGVYPPINITSSGSLSGKTVASMVAGASHSLVLCTDKTLHSFGYNYYGQLGTSTYFGTSNSILTPTNITSAIVE